MTSNIDRHGTTKRSAFSSLQQISEPISSRPRLSQDGTGEAEQAQSIVNNTVTETTRSLRLLLSSQLLDLGTTQWTGACPAGKNPCDFRCGWCMAGSHGPLARCNTNCQARKLCMRCYTHGHKVSECGTKQCHFVGLCSRCWTNDKGDAAGFSHDGGSWGTDCPYTGRGIMLPFVLGYASRNWDDLIRAFAAFGTTKLKRLSCSTAAQQEFGQWLFSPAILLGCVTDCPVLWLAFIYGRAKLTHSQDLVEHLRSWGIKPGAY